MISLLVFSFRYYNLDAYHRKAMEKEKKKGLKVSVTERTVFNDEEQRRYVKMKLFWKRKTFVGFHIVQILFLKHGTSIKLLVSFLDLPDYGLCNIIFTLIFWMVYEGNIMKPLYFNWVFSFSVLSSSFNYFFFEKIMQIRIVEGAWTTKGGRSGSFKTLYASWTG